MKAQQHGAVETRSAVVDVLLLDVLAEIESLLRTGRELQRELLQVRGVPWSTTTEQKRKAARRAHSLATSMTDDARSLSKVVRELRGKTNRLARHVNGTRR